MLSLNCAKASRELTVFLKNYFNKAGFDKAVIGLSGGVDSATSCALAVRALGAENVYPVLLPYGELSKLSTKDAWLVSGCLKIPKENITEIDIEPWINSRLSLEFGMDNLRRGNLMARLRMAILFDQAKKRKALVVGTENKTEHLLGYFTRFGDEASDIEPLRNLYKTQVYELAKYLELPEPTLTKAPTAGLWPGQTDEGEFGFIYKEADEILSLLYDDRKSVEEIVATGRSREVVEKVKLRHDQNDFKHHLPVLP